MDPRLYNILEAILGNISSALNILQPSISERSFNLIYPTITLVQDIILTLGGEIESEEYELEDVINALNLLRRTIADNEHMFRSPVFGNFMENVGTLIIYVVDNVIFLPEEEHVARAA